MDVHVARYPAWPGAQAAALALGAGWRDASAASADALFLGQSDLVLMLGFLLSVGAAWLAHRWRMRREGEHARRLEHQVRERTRTLRERNLELKSLNRQLAEASLTDPLTGLRNRRFVFEEMAREQQGRRAPERRRGNGGEKRELIFFMLDLDHFKPVNDTCGHDAGDQLLLQIRDALAQVQRARDCVVRWGGDEFLIIARDVTIEDAEHMAERMRRVVSRRLFRLESGKVARTTCSVGFACHPFLPDHPELLDWQQVLSLADTMMYRAKRSRNGWVGIVSNSRTPAVPDLFDRIQAGLEDMAEADEVTVRSHFAQTHPRMDAHVDGMTG